MERCLTELEMRPDDAGLLGEIFRAVHTIKGTTGFLGFDRLEKLAHAGEHLLGSLRDGRLAVTSELISGLLQLMDGLRAILLLIEETGGEGTRSGDEDSELIAELALLNGEIPPAQIESELLHAVVDTGESATAVPSADQASKISRASGPPSAAANSERNGAASDKTLRIDVDVLNRMMNLVGELVLTRNQMLQSDMAGEDAAGGESVWQISQNGAGPGENLWPRRADRVYRAGHGAGQELAGGDQRSSHPRGEERGRSWN
jgi:two-component system chemotaxis sensor kinase CheA